MRDGLSILDQVLSFGEGPVTAERVREVLGLIPDDLYGEMLRVIAERDAPAVFVLVDRLTEAGADLSEFVSGAGETLRAVLLVGLGGELQGVTEGLEALVRQYAPRLPPPDVVRLLTVLGEAERQIRSSGNTRLAVELLLLRWALMDRTVELQDVITALGRGTGTSERAPTAPPQLRDSVPSSPVPPPPSPVPETGPLTLDRLRALWPQIVADARAKSQMLGALIAATEVVMAEGTTLTIRLLEENAVHAEGIERQREALVALVGRYVTDAIRIKLVAAEGVGGSRARPARLTEDGARAERLSGLRAKDPLLDAAVEALDLELLE
jgi:DNA polymerase-3 subunit gamma/tau